MLFVYKSTYNRTNYLHADMISILYYRELKETRHRFDSQGIEIRKKENQLKEMQTKLEQGEGCKLNSGR